MITRKDITAEAQKWLNVPWHHQGRTKQGIDCAGYVYTLATILGIDTKGYNDDTTYGPDPDDTMDAVIDKYLDRKHIMQRLPGSILFFAFGNKGQHLGIMSNDPRYFYHAFRFEGKVVQTRLDRRWNQPRLRGVYDFYGVID